jgi:hypothetical protein
MKPNEEKDRLLDDILGGEDAGWRNGALAQVRRVARRRRLVRRARHVTAGLIVVAAVAVTLRFYDKPAPDRKFVESSGLITIHSLPLPSSMIMHSTEDGFALVRTLELPAQLVRTESAENLPRQIDDDELLRLAGDSAILVRHAPGEAQLVLSDTTRARSLFSIPPSDTEN